MSESKRCRQPLINGFNKYGILAYPIETGRTRRGVSDIFINLEGLVVWMECKEVEEVDCAQIEIDFEPLQKSFLIENFREGGISIVALRTPDAFIFTHINNIDDDNKMIKQDRHILTLYKLDIPVLIKWLQTFNSYLALHL